MTQKQPPLTLNSVCDLQTAFTSAIHCFSSLLAPTNKLLRASEILSIPVFATTQNRGKLGSTVPELNIDAHPQLAGHWDKTKFSMAIPEVVDKLKPASNVAIVGIESHICVTQTALDLLALGHNVYIIADGELSLFFGVALCVGRAEEASETGDLGKVGNGRTKERMLMFFFSSTTAVSSCNPQEVPIALARLRSAGATVTTSESWIYEVMGDSKIEQFRQIAKLVKETSGETKKTLQSLL